MSRLSGTSVNRRRFGAMLAGASALAMGARAQGKFPERPVTLIVPYGTGTGTDALGRRLASAMPELIGQSMIVDNKAGASAQIGAMAAARSAPDGHTLLIAGDQVMCFNPVLFKSLAYVPSRDFVPVAGLTIHPYVLVVSSSSPVRSLADLVALARTKAGGLTFASTGVATSAHLVGEVFKQEARINMSHVPYQSGAQMYPDLIEDRVSMLFYPYQQLKPFLDAGKLRALATTTEHRTDWLSDVPCMPELGYPRSVLAAWLAVYAPAHTPPDRVRKLSEAFKKALEMPDLGGQLPPVGIDVRYRSPAELAAFGDAQSNVCREVVKIAGAKLE